MSSTVEQIKARLSIADVVGSYLKLDKAGINFKACCPFHNEKTPSFFVSPNRDSYHCFGCGKGGDIFSFVQEIEGVEFVEALKVLADRAGVTLEQNNKTDTGERDRLLALLAAATGHYAEAMAAAPLVRGYLHNRGLTDVSIKQFEIGYVPDAWRTMVTFLRGKGFTDSEIEKSGLAIRGEIKPGQPEAPFYDRFRSRIMFPIKDGGGRVIGFSGRIYGSTSSPQAAEVAKYINSPQTLVYDKSKALYGFNLAKLAIRQANCAVLVEGQMDLVMSHQSGVTNAVAVSGTALTEEHLRALRRLADSLVMAFDGDLAGIRAAKRAVEMALLLDFEVRIAELPDGVDPADLTRENPAKWQTAVSEAKHVIDFYLSILSRGQTDKRELAKSIRTEVLPYVARLSSRLDQAHFVQKISQLVALPEAPIWEEVDRYKGTVPSIATTAKPANNKTRSERVGELLFGLVWWQESMPTAVLDAAKIIQSVKEVFGTEADKVVAGYEAKKNQLVMAAELSYEKNQGLPALVDDLLRQFKQEVLKERLAVATDQLKVAEAAGDQAALDICLKTCQDISNQLRNLS